jgi:hypothetical protein
MSYTMLMYIVKLSCSKVDQCYHHDAATQCMLTQAYDNARRLRNATAGFKLYNKRQVLVPLDRVPTPTELRNTAVTGITKVSV